MFRQSVVGPSPQAAAQAQARQVQEQAAAAQEMAMAATELEYRVELLNRMVAGCFEKCSARPLSCAFWFRFFCSGPFGASTPPSRRSLTSVSPPPPLHPLTPASPLCQTPRNKTKTGSRTGPCPWARPCAPTAAPPTATPLPRGGDLAVRLDADVPNLRPWQPRSRGEEQLIDGHGETGLGEVLGSRHNGFLGAGEAADLAGLQFGKSLVSLTKTEVGADAGENLSSRERIGDEIDAAGIEAANLTGGVSKMLPSGLKNSITSRLRGTRFFDRV